MAVFWTASFLLSVGMFQGLGAQQARLRRDVDRDSWVEVTGETRQEILRHAFPVNRRDPPATTLIFVLRFLPSFHPESQIVIRYADDWQVSLDYMAAGVGLQTVLHDKYPDEPVPNARAVAAEMNVQRHLLRIPAATAQDWYRGCWKALGGSLAASEKRGPEKSLQLDGTTYVCEYEEGMGRWSLELQGSEVSDPNPANDLPVIQWMNKIRREVEALAGESAHEK